MIDKKTNTKNYLNEIQVHSNKIEDALLCVLINKN